MNPNPNLNLAMMDFSLGGSRGVGGHGMGMDLGNTFRKEGMSLNRRSLVRATVLYFAWV
jgi:hypothetical protein